MVEISCGTIPYTIIDGNICYLLIKAKNNGYWGFPKGHVEDGENEIETAIRETFEETSVNVNITYDFRYEISYLMNNGNEKTVVYFLACFSDQQPKHSDGFEDFDYLILSFDEAYQTLTFENEKQMLSLANVFLGELL